MIQLSWDILSCQLVNSCKLQGFHSCVIVRSARLERDIAVNYLALLKIKVMHSFEVLGTT